VDSGFNYDVEYKHEAERRTSPCLRGIDFKIKDNYLIMSVIFRSWDLYTGFPENMGGMALLNEYIAEQLDDVKPGPLAFTSAGLHAYDYQIDPIMSILKK
jgi:thymidylate synthase